MHNGILEGEEKERKRISEEIMAEKLKFLRIEGA